jgi:serine/threonine-protein kinase HipA
VVAEPVDTAFVNLWGFRVGAVAWDPERDHATFEYDHEFLDRGLDLAPLRMPLSDARRGLGVFSFPALPRETYRGLPGLLADALPDRYGNAVINAWLARQGRSPESFSPVERLCYVGTRAVGALEFQPAIQDGLDRSVPVEVAELVALAQEVVAYRERLRTRLAPDPADALLDIIRVGTSAGGGRPKAVIALNDATGEVRSGQVTAPRGFDAWLLKFDGVQDESLGDPAGYGRIEYAYSRMAGVAGITMSECRLLEENGRAHFLTRRFDRPGGARKLHLQSLCGIAHFDFNAPGAYSYEQAFQVMRRLRLPYPDAAQMFRRLVFNVVARNQDDHTKNISFVMDEEGTWRLAPAYDVTYAYNPRGRFTALHQMSVNGKREAIERDDLLAVAHEMNVKSAAAIVDEVVEAVARWPEFAGDAGVTPARVERIGKTHRLLRG